MQVDFFDCKRQLKVLQPDINNALKKVLNSGKLVLGKEVNNFEKRFSRYIGTKYAVGVNSGTDAIKIAIRSLDIGKGDEIITVANTAVPTVSALRETGAIPKFVDIKKDFNINQFGIEKAINNKTKAILVVHLYGQPCEMNYILEIAKEYQLKVIEDCSQSHGANIKGKKVGNFGHLSCFSFYPTKNLGAYGDGGVILTSSKKLANKCRMLRMYGMRNKYYSYLEGYNSRLDEIQAAVLNIKLKYLDQWNQKRQLIANYYLTHIKNPNIILPDVQSLKEHVFYLFVIRTNKRKDLIRYLNKAGIGSHVHYPFPIHLQKAYKFLNYKKGSLPVTEKFANEVLSLPIFPELTMRELKYIVDRINKFQ